MKTKKLKLALHICLFIGIVINLLLFINLYGFLSKIGYPVIPILFIFHLLPYALCMVFKNNPIVALGGVLPILVFNTLVYWASFNIIDDLGVILILFYPPSVNILILLPLGIALTIFTPVVTHYLKTIFTGVKIV